MGISSTYPIMLVRAGIWRLVCGLYPHSLPGCSKLPIVIIVSEYPSTAIAKLTFNRNNNINLALSIYS